MSRVPALPPRLLPGQTIGLISPSGPASPAVVEAARVRLSQEGFRTVVGRHALDVRGYLAGNDADRAADVHAMFVDPDIHAVLCVRGGYGAMRLLDALQYDLIRRYPKIFVGYSDVTALHLAFYHRAGFVTFHGPMATAIAKDDGHDLHQLLRAVTLPQPLGPLVNPPGAPEIEPLVPGAAEGTLIGGNLALLTSLLGTPYLPPFSGAVLFIEDIVDHLYRLDRKLVHLRLAGVLEQVAGIVVGESSARERTAGGDAPPPELDRKSVV